MLVRGKSKPKEWRDDYNSFNSYKGLLYHEWYRAILEGNFMPPIEVNLDPVNACQLNCEWCNNKVTKSRGIIMDTLHMLNLIKFFKGWGVKALCIAGGGEPTLHHGLADAFNLCKHEMFPVALMTNGLFMDKAQLMAAAETCRWIGISVDCCNAETYKQMKGLYKFERVIENMERLIAYGAREVTYKFLIHPKNQYQIYDAIEMAHNIGCHRIHIRPLSFRNYQESEDNYDVDAISSQVATGRRQYENNNFQVYYIQHKFNDDLHRKFEFDRCRATPIMGIFEANGDIMLCVDRKNDKQMVFGNHSDISKIKDIWGARAHKECIESVRIKDCGKCTFNVYNQQIEKAIINDKMDWRFV